MSANQENNTKLINFEQEKNFLNLQDTNVTNRTHVYFRRWVVLFIYASISTLVAFNWLEYNIIQDVTIQFYNASLPGGY